jgi:hypothetical protein
LDERPLPSSFVVHLSSSASRNQAALYALREGIAALDDGDE